VHGSSLGTAEVKGNVIGKLTNHYGVLLSVIVLVVFTGTLLRFSAGGQPATRSAQSGADDFRSEISVLDNDGYPDGTANPLAMLGLDLVAVVVGVVLPLAPLVSSRLLLVVHEPPRLFSAWGLALERPG
jgi:hypothetical protein